jgi:hypothetical protein
VNINGLELPEELASDLGSGGRKLDRDEFSRLKKALSLVTGPSPKFYSYETIVKVNRLWASESARFYLGQAGGSVVPGDIDPERALIIGEAEPDSPIVLDYRTINPRVAYYGDVDHTPCWIELSSDYAGLIQMLRGE